MTPRRAHRLARTEALAAGVAVAAFIAGLVATPDSQQITWANAGWFAVTLLFVFAAVACSDLRNGHATWLDRFLAGRSSRWSAQDEARFRHPSTQGQVQR